MALRVGPQSTVPCSPVTDGLEKATTGTITQKTRPASVNAQRLPLFATLTGCIKARGSERYRHLGSSDALTVEFVRESARPCFEKLLLACFPPGRVLDKRDCDSIVEGLICDITGAEAATVVNNNAAAVLLTLAALAQGREVVVSRGEQVEIGGAFRMPDVMASAGATMVEVGTTNRTHLADYERAITPQTALLMKVHTSNYAVQGFTSTVTEAELAPLAQARGVALATDLGSGSLIDMTRYGLPAEPTPQQMLAAGCDVVTFSGDKLLGGPQVGIVAGRKDLVARVAKNPMKRALRLDKIRLAALEATLKLYRDPERLLRHLPTLRMFTRPRADIATQAARLLPAASRAVAPDYQVDVVESDSQIGSGAQPLRTLPSAALALRPAAREGAGRALEKLSLALRALQVPVIGRIHDGALLLDLRCLEDDSLLVGQLEELPRVLARVPARPPRDR